MMQWKVHQGGSPEDCSHLEKENVAFSDLVTHDHLSRKATSTVWNNEGYIGEK